MKKVFLLVLTVIALSLVFSVSVSASETDSEISLFEALENDLYIDDIDCEEVYVDDGTNSKITLFSIESSLSASFISNSTNKQYINTMINYYLNEHAQLLSTLKAGNPVVMFFEGGSDNVDNSKYNSDNKYRMSAVCIVLKYNFTTSSVYIAYANENCTTMPDHPLAYGSYDNGKGSEYGTATLKDGVYGIYTVNHQGKYAGFNIRNNGSGSVPAVYMKSNGGYSELNASGINIHTRTLPYVSGKSNPWSAGCILVGASTPFTDYNSFIETTAPSTSTKTTTTYKSNSIYKYSSGTGVSCGMLVMDRYLYRSKMLEIYKNQNAIDCITNFSVKSYIAATGSTPEEPETCIHSYVEGIEGAHPHRKYVLCSLCGHSYYTGEIGATTNYEGAHPHREYYICPVTCVYDHTYSGNYGATTNYEGAHPHREYYICPVTCVYDHTYSGNYGTTTNYESTYPYKEYHICQVTCNYDYTYTGDTAAPYKPVLKNMKSEYILTENVVLSWDNVKNATHYNLYIDKFTDRKYTRTTAIHYAENGLEQSFEPGEYRIQLQATNSNYWTEDNSTWLYTDGDWIYFSVLEKETPYTSSSITKSGNTLTIHTGLHNFTTPYDILIVGYKGNQFVTMKRVPHNEQNSPYTLEGDIDKIKVMVWSDLSTLKPLCEAEEITNDKFIIE